MLKNKMELGHVQRGLIVRNERANDEYTTEFIYKEPILRKPVSGRKKFSDKFLPLYDI
jgi:hypothetical protein